MVSVKLENLTKTFSGGTVIAVNDLTLKIKEGEFFTFLGPSGCGKTTVLRMIAGFYYPDNGRVYFDDKDVTDVPPYERNTGMVFQNYALWPHMNVFDNVAYGLKIKKLPKPEIEKKVKEVLELVHLSGYEDRMPYQLSGGQQQRIALARALIVEPEVLLLDEPLSNLDAKLRVEMRAELIRIQKELGITAIYVTHDQEEAMAISHRIAVLNKGKLQQVGTPREIYDRPKNLFVADFIGECSFFLGKIDKIDKELIEVKSDFGVTLKGVKTYNEYDFSKGEEVVVAIRPEDFYIKPQEGKENNKLSGAIQYIVFLGKYNRLFVNIGGKLIQVTVDANLSFEEQQKIDVFAPVNQTMVLPLDKEVLREIKVLEVLQAV